MKNKFVFKILFLILFFTMITFTFCTKSNAAVTLNSTNIDLYALSLNDYMNYRDKFGEFPEQYPESFQFVATGVSNPKFKLSSSYYDITEDGLLTVKSRSFVTKTLNIYVNDELVTVTATLHDYRPIYIENYINDFLSNNITPGMTDYEKTEVVCNWICQFEYGGGPTIEDYILFGKGTCYASTDALTTMLRKLNIPVKAHDAPNTLSDVHRNAVALIDGTVCEIEAGYNEPAPRKYFIMGLSQKGSSDGFYTMEKPDGTIKIKEHIGFSHDVVVPDEIRGKVVTEIDDECFCANFWYEEYAIKNVTLPNTITKIGDLAFWGQCGIENINIPDSVTEIGEGFICGRSIENLLNTNITISSSHKYFKVKDNFLMSKDGSRLLALLKGNIANIKIPDSVCEIDGYAFGFTNIETVEMSDNVTKIGKYAFRRCDNLYDIKLSKNLSRFEDGIFYYDKKLKLKLNDNVTYIGNFAFIGTGMEKNIFIPKSVTYIGTNAFAACYIEQIIIEEGCQTAFGDYVFNAKFLDKFYIPSTINNIDKDIFTRLNTSDYGLKTDIYGKAGSFAKTYAEKYKINFIACGEVTRKNKDNFLNFVGADKYISEKYSSKITLSDGTIVRIVDPTKQGESFSTCYDFFKDENCPCLSCGPYSLVDYSMSVYNSAGVKKYLNVSKFGSRDVIKVNRMDDNDSSYVTYTTFVTEYIVTIPGDVDGDGSTKIIDSFKMLKDTMQGKPMDEIDVVIRDYDKNGKITMIDSFNWLKNAMK